MPMTPEAYGSFETAWCPGCGNFALLDAVKGALADLDLAPHQVLFVSGIGQAAKSPHYLRANLFNGLHGRVLPVATGAKLANPELIVIGQSGDGCNYGEGGNHLLAAIRRNVDLTLLVHNNRVYGLTKGQASPTSPAGFATKAQPFGVTSAPFEPLVVAIAMQASFVARGFTGEGTHLRRIIAEAIRHPGFSLVDILQPCVTFNRVNTFKWYRERCYPVDEGHDPSDPAAAMAVARTDGDRIALGVLFRAARGSFHEQFRALRSGPLIERPVDRRALAEVLRSFR